LPYLPVGWFWYLGALLPVIGLVQILGGHALADRYTYFPLIGFFIMLSWAARDLLGRWRVPWPVPALGGMAALVALGIVAWVQVGYWHDSEVLWQHALEVDKNNWLAHNNLADALGPKGDPEEQLFYFQEALAHGPLGLDLPVKGIGFVLAERGRWPEAVEHFRAALELRPEDPDIHSKLGIALVNTGNAEEAAEQFQQALRLKPDHVEAHLNLAFLRFGQGKSQEALDHFSQALALDPDIAVRSCNQAAWAMATYPDASTRNGPLALALARKLCGARGPAQADLLDTLAAALAENDQFREAAAVASEALSLAKAQNPRWVPAIQARLELYRSGRPFRTTPGKASKWEQG
jgi:Flp pilus assembly protein TadD